jgi:hypothetical protein
VCVRSCVGDGMRGSGAGIVKKIFRNIGVGVVCLHMYLCSCIYVHAWGAIFCVRVSVKIMV